MAMYTRTDIPTEHGDFYVLAAGRHQWLYRESTGVFVGVYGTLEQAQRVAEAVGVLEGAACRIAAARVA